MELPSGLHDAFQLGGDAIAEWLDRSPMPWNPTTSSDVSMHDQTPVESLGCAYIGAPQGKPEPCIRAAAHSGPHKHAEKSPATRCPVTGVDCIRNCGYRSCAIAATT
jgi:hypothetical protein